jgi:hypothetical protein
VSAEPEEASLPVIGWPCASPTRICTETGGVEFQVSVALPKPEVQSVITCGVIDREF